jgi:hypothetical protein
MKNTTPITVLAAFSATPTRGFPQPRREYAHCALRLCAAWFWLLGLPFFSQAQYRYTTNNDGTITIAEYLGSGGAVAIPNSIDGRLVTIVGDFAFRQKDALTAVTLPNSVTYIGAYAFAECVALTSLTFPDNLAGLGPEAFSRCTNLTSVTIPGGVTNLGGRAFEFCTGLTNLTIGTGVTSIGDWAFSYCAGLTDVTIPDSVTHLGGGAFAGTALASVAIGNGVTNLGEDTFELCSELATVAIGSGVRDLGEHPFSGCTSLTNLSVSAANTAYSSLDGVVFNKTHETLVLCPKGRLGGYNVPDTVTNIGDSAFADCDRLTDIMIPNSVNYIGYSAFDNCTALASITIPNSVVSLGESALSNCAGLTSIVLPESITNLDWSVFAGCTGLKNLTVNPLSPVYSASDGVLFNKSQDTLLIYPPGRAGAYFVPSSATHVANSAFNDCLGLTSIVIPDTLRSIGDAAFQGCRGLGSIVIPNSVTNLGISIFSYCTGLTNIIFPNTLSNLPDDTFAGCTGLTSVMIPPSVTTLGDGAFSDCTSLTSVTIADNLISFGADAFSGCSSLTRVTIPPKVTTIGPGTFAGCTGLTNLSIPTNVTRIGESAFGGCTGLRSVVLPDNLRTIERRAFLSCSGLTSLTIPDSVTHIGDGAFSYCTGLVSVTIGSGLTEIDFCECYGGWAFSGWINLTNITVAPLNPVFSSMDGVLLNKAQDLLILYPAGRRGHYTIPNSVNSFGGAFADCQNLTSLTLGSGISTWPGGFAGDASLTNITVDPLNASFSSLDGVLYNKSLDMLIACPKARLGTLIVPDGVTTVTDGAFSRSGLSSVIFPKSLNYIDLDAFVQSLTLNSVFFSGQAPTVQATFEQTDSFTVYYLPGNTGWGSSFGGRPAVLWNPTLQVGNASSSAGTNGFRFNVDGTKDLPIVVEASTSLTDSTWVPLQTSTLTSGLVSFYDREWTNYPTRFYRIRAP